MAGFGYIIAGAGGTKSMLLLEAGSDHRTEPAKTPRKFMMIKGNPI